MGEFGRTPKINSAGRARPLAAVLLRRSGRARGSPGGRTSARATGTARAPRVGPVVTPLMVGTTIAELAGVDAEARAALRVLDGGSVIHEIV